MKDLLATIDNLLANSIIQELNIPELFGDYTLHLLREDLIHPEISGNKLRKLKYNLLEAKRLGKKQLVTFGGAYSNHIAATAAAGKLVGFDTVGIIRGDELSEESNETLQRAASNGMKFEFWPRESYKDRNDGALLAKLALRFPEAFIIPEGGSNNLGLQGCREIVSYPNPTQSYSHLVCACGTGTTLAGLVSGLKSGQKALGISVLAGNFLSKDAGNQLAAIDCQTQDWEINSSFHFGGYARISGPLIEFIERFYELSGTFAEPVYTGKMLFAIHQLSKNHYFPENSRILALHTGGLQGWNGFADLNPFKQNFNQG